jgi:hypothetical protein
MSHTPTPWEMLYEKARKERDELVAALREIEANPQHARIIAIDALAKVAQL